MLLANATAAWLVEGSTKAVSLVVHQPGIIVAVKRWSFAAPF
jgi:hypothetical protein